MKGSTGTTSPYRNKSVNRPTPTVARMKRVLERHRRPIGRPENMMGVEQGQTAGDTKLGRRTRLGIDKDEWEERPNEKSFLAYLRDEGRIVVDRSMTIST
jgi:hypothetical protein